MRKIDLRQYAFAFRICLALAGIGYLPYMFIGPKDATVLQGVYYIGVVSVSLLFTLILAIERFSYDSFDKSGWLYCLVGLINTISSSVGLFFILRTVWSVWVLFLCLVLVTGILINRDILKQQNVSRITGK